MGLNVVSFQNKTIFKPPAALSAFLFQADLPPVWWSPLELCPTNILFQCEKYQIIAAGYTVLLHWDFGKQHTFTNGSFLILRHRDEKLKLKCVLPLDSALDCPLLAFRPPGEKLIKQEGKKDKDDVGTHHHTLMWKVLFLVFSHLCLKAPSLCTGGISLKT